MKYKVGDKVRITSSDSNKRWHGFEIGKIVTITECNYDNDDYLLYDGDGCNQWILGCMFEKVNQEQVIEVGKRYKSENGSEWECIAVKGDTAWLVVVYGGSVEGSAYSFKTDGTPICLRYPVAYRIKFEPVVEWIECRVCWKFDEFYNDHRPSKYGYVNLTIHLPLIYGKPDFTQARIEEA